MRAGIDVGGTKIEGIVLGEDGRERARLRRPTPVGDYSATLDVIAGIVADLEAEVGAPIDKVGAGTPGATDPATGLLRNANSVALNDRPLEQDLATRLARPVKMANDADCLTLSEAHDGAAAGGNPVFGVILGTGVGGGVVVDGRLVTGANGIAGEWGHIPLQWPHADELPGPRCYCGRRGCGETYLAGPGLERAHADRSGHLLRAAEIAGSAEEGDPVAMATMREYADRLARGLASIINILDPEVIVAGGGVSNITMLYDMVPAFWSRYVFADSVLTRFVKARHGDSSGVRGAALLWG